MPKRKELSDHGAKYGRSLGGLVRENERTPRSSTEMKVSHLEERIVQLQMEIADWKAVPMQLSHAARHSEQPIQ